MSLFFNVHYTVVINSRTDITPRCYSPAVERVGTGDDVGAVAADEEADALVEGLQGALAGGDLRLLDDVQGIGRAHAQRRGVARGLQTAVWVHAVHQTICTREAEEEEEEDEEED